VVVEPCDETFTRDHPADEKRSLFGRRQRREPWRRGDRLQRRPHDVLADRPQRESVNGGTIEAGPRHERDVVTGTLQRSGDAHHGR
jgi:hypothetical protein